MSNNPQNYINNSLNTSKTKQTFSFAKSKRFPKHKRLLTDVSYQLPSALDKRTTTFGYGNKLDFGRSKSKSPPPGTYELPGGIGKGKQNAISFAPGRQQVSANSFLQMAKSLSKYPSPNKYNPHFESFSRKSGYIGKRLATQIDMCAKKKTPGPGSYEMKAIEMSSGTYFLSSFRNNASPRYHSVSHLQSINSKKRTLMPSFYNTQQKEIGKYTVSRFKNTLGRTFSKARRQGLEDKTKISIPGCKYRRFSEFGGNLN